MEIFTKTEIIFGFVLLILTSQPVCSLMLATMKKKIGRGENKRNFLKPHLKLVQQTPQRLLKSCKMKGNFSTIDNHNV